MGTIEARVFRQITGLYGAKIGCFFVFFFFPFLFAFLLFLICCFCLSLSFLFADFLLINLFSLFFIPLSFPFSWHRWGSNGPLGAGAEEPGFRDVGSSRKLILSPLIVWRLLFLLYRLDLYPCLSTQVTCVASGGHGRIIG
ncbi:hypothetical protein B9Z19DRAFT_376817 [Tuber borchii]|uniref:Uncharacterized protein n=1 Tax=Tuber borchii TaxID=42251 RepID=A0A2T6ZHQ7_TUBBO|nr:hypothetical protein B9Z19DRAFT_376817 [Tuber borchii]